MVPHHRAPHWTFSNAILHRSAKMARMYSTKHKHNFHSVSFSFVVNRVRFQIKCLVIRWTCAQAISQCRQLLDDGRFICQSQRGICLSFILTHLELSKTTEIEEKKIASIFTFVLCSFRYYS